MQEHEGAKKARATIKAFHHCLNSPALLPLQTYIPSNIGSGPVCAINQIVGLFFSQNYEPIPGMIKLAFSHFGQLDGSPVFESYKQIAFDYLCQVSYFLVEFTDLDNSKLQYTIPQEILKQGSKEAPSYNASSQIFEKV